MEQKKNGVFTKIAHTMNERQMHSYSLQLQEQNPPIEPSSRANLSLLNRMYLPSLRKKKKENIHSQYLETFNHNQFFVGDKNTTISSLRHRVKLRVYIYFFFIQSNQVKFFVFVFVFTFLFLYLPPTF